MLAVIFYATALTATQAATIKQALYAACNMAPQLQDRLILAADSIGAGANADFGQTWPRLARPLLNRAYRIFNQGVSGQTAAWFVTNWSTAMAPLFATGVRNTVIFSLGTNDIAVGDSAATVYGHLTTLIANAKAASGYYSVGIATVLPRSNTPLSGGGAAQETVRTALNTLILANTAGADFIVDIGGGAVMGPYANASDALLYVGGLHPTPLGQAYNAVKYADAINVWG